MATSLSITYANPSSSRQPVDALFIEQDDWKPYAGYVTKAAVVQYLASIFWPEDAFNPQFDCGIVGGQMICPVYVYPYEPGLAYQLRTSYGTLSPRAVKLVEYTETINPNLQLRVATKYPAQSILKAKLVRDVWDADGNPAPTPQVTIEGKEILLSGAIHGALDVTYMVERHAYILTADARKDVPENLFSAVVVALYQDGIKWLKMEPPPGADEYLEGVDDCAWGWHSTGSIAYPDDAHTRPVAAYADRHRVFDYCGNTLLSDTTTTRVEIGEE